MAQDQDTGWEDVTDPAEITKVVGAKAAAQLTGLEGKTGKPVPAWAAKPYEEEIGIYGELAAARNRFNKDFAGNTLTGGLENTIQGMFGSFGTEGQRDWWASFRRMDNVVRNKLFGATLTPSEQKAYADTSINERMDPEEVQRNLDTRVDIVRKALARKTKFLKAQGYSDDAIEALAGQYAPELGAVPEGSRGGSDAELKFNDEGRPERGYRFTPDQEAQIAKAVRDGDEGQLIALMQSFSGNPAPPTPEQRESIRRAIEAAQRGGGVTIDYSGLDKSAQGKADRERYGTFLDDALRERKGQVVDPLIRGAADTASFGFADEMAAAANTIFSGGTMRENLQRERAIDEADQRQNFLARFGGQVAGGLLLPVAGARAGVPVARTPAGMAVEGGGYGVGYGFGSGEGGVDDRLLSAGAGGATGAGAGYFGGKLLNKLTGKKRGAGETAADVVDQGMDHGIDVPLDVAGGRGAKIVGNTLSNMPGSAQVMNNARQRLAGQVEKAVDDVAGKFGTANSFMGMGEAGQRGAKNWISRFEEVSGKVYDAIPISSKAAANLSNTQAVLTDLTTKFASNPKLAEAMSNSRLSKYMDALGEKGAALSWEDLKAFRSRIGEEIGDTRFSDGTLKSELRALYGALSEDMRATAAALGPKELRAFERANNLYRKGQERIDTALISILGDDGRKSPEAAARALQTIAKSGKGSSDLKKLAQIRASMPTEEWGDVASSMVRLLGQPANSEGREFSAQTFMRNYNDMSDGAKNLLFGDRGRQELRENLDDFTKVVGRIAESDALRNTSNTAGQVLTGLGLFSVGNLPLVIGQAVGSYGAAHLFTNPKFVRWATGYAKMLKGAEKANGKPNIEGQMRLLDKLAVSQPTIAAEVTGLRQMLTQAANDNWGQLAAGSGDEKKKAPDR